ncbi:MAG TPA: hypothetical protein VG798_02220 [Rhizomicrobium sp.]|nr:hypothetical protein [Rhizomicrobium sp.]
MTFRLIAPLFVLALTLTPAFAQAPSKAVTAGAFLAERPTLNSLGFEWKVSGDANRNAQVEVTYRVKGETQWRKALPLFRMNGEQVPGPKPHFGDRNYYDYIVPNMFAGSILNLKPDTVYETRFTLSDPDGVKGRKQQAATVRTRAVPAPASGGHVYHVYPFGFKGVMQQPGFIGLMTAYYMGSDESDHSNTMPPRVRPGDIILVHAGTYKDQRFVYGGFDASVPAYGTPFDGTYYLTQSGTPDKPIVIKAAGDGEVIFDGDGAQNLFNLMGASYNYFDGITVRNTNVAFLLGIKNIIGSSGFTLTHSRFEDVGRVVQEDWAATRDIYIADNVMIGRHDPEHVTSWNHPEAFARYPGFPATTTSEYAVKVYGQGIVVTRNYVANFHDAIDIATYGDPSDKPSEQASSIDISGNDMFNMSDNCVELDGGVHNVRAFDNRCVNATGGAFSTQPIFGGPAYIFRNLAYNSTTGGGLKLLDTPSGVLIYQNTFIGQGTMLGPLSNVQLRNNLFVGDSWKVAVFDFRTYTSYSSSDYNGFGPNAGVANNFGWSSPAPGIAADYGRLPNRRYASLADYQAGSSQDGHSVLVGLDAFQNVKPTDQANPPKLYSPEDYDFTLKPDSAAIDRGIELPTITDGFNGRAPDLGALEYGAPLPHYGPAQWPAGGATSGPRSITGPPR